MAEAKLTSSGNWRIRVYDHTDRDGKKIYKCITRPTKDECEYEALLTKMKVHQQDIPRTDKTVGEVVDEYIRLCEVLSPTTIMGYHKIRNTSFEHIWNMSADDMDDVAMQKAINVESRRNTRRGKISPKTVKNEYGLISSAMKSICGKTFIVKLPKSARKLKEYPDPFDVFSVVYGTDIELPCVLAMWLSFSMSEIRGLKFSDIKNGYIHINRVIVDVNNIPTVKKTGKAEKRIRKHRLPEHIADLIDRQPHNYEYIIQTPHDTIRKKFQRLCRENGMEMTFHELRHLNASVMLALNIPEKYAMERGGWSTSNTMKTVYEHTFSKERIIVDDKMDEYFNNIVQQLDAR